MNSNTETNLENQSIETESTDSDKKNSKPSATTNDIPEFGWSGYAERANGRFAMIGFTSLLLIEAITRETFLHWAGIIK